MSSTAYPVIVTHYLSPTNYRGARIVAKTEDDRITVPYSYEGQSHEKAALALLAKIGLPARKLIKGFLPNGDYVFLIVSPENIETV